MKDDNLHHIVFFSIVSLALLFVNYNFEPSSLKRMSSVDEISGASFYLEDQLWNHEVALPRVDVFDHKRDFVGYYERRMTDWSKNEDLKLMNASRSVLAYTRYYKNQTLIFDSTDDIIATVERNALNTSYHIHNLLSNPDATMRTHINNKIHFWNFKETVLYATASKRETDTYRGLRDIWTVTIFEKRCINPTVVATLVALQSQQDGFKRLLQRVLTYK